MYKKANKDHGRGIKVILEKPSSGMPAQSDTRNRTITIDPDLSEAEATAAIIFELHNLSTWRPFNTTDNNAIAGRLSKKDYVRRTAEIEYNNFKAAAPFIRAAVKSIDPNYVSVAQRAVDAKNFDEWFENSPASYIKVYEDWWTKYCEDEWKTYHPGE